jgi:hypothetical protein
MSAMRKFWVLPAAALAVLLAGGIVLHADSDNGPIWGQSDTGQMVRLMRGVGNGELTGDGGGPRFAPPVGGPHNAASVYRASYGLGNLRYHGGKVMTGPKFYAIFWNSAVANSTDTSLGYGSLQTQITSFVSTFLTGSSYTGSSTDNYTIVGQYNDSSNNRPLPGNGLAGSYVDSQSTLASITDGQIQSYLASLFTAGKLSANSSTIYGVYFPSGMQIVMGNSASCTAFCGYHSIFTYNGVNVKYAVFPYTNCSGCKLTNLAVADMLTIVTSHETREAATDPGDNGNAWYDLYGYEADDKCAWHNLYQMKRPAGLNFWVQPEYSNGGGIYPGSGCVVP